MKKFSKIRPGNKDPKDEVLYSGAGGDLIKYDDWNVFKNKDCIICIPILIELNQIILRWEYVPTYKYVDGTEYHITSVAGGIERGESPKEALIRELEEEAGLVIRPDYEIEDMRPLFSNKGQTGKLYPFILPLNERDYQEVIAKGDGSRLRN